MSFNLEIESKPTVKTCQVISLPLVNFSQMTSFGERLKIAFNNARNAEIARKIEVSEPMIKKYLSGSMPSIETLITIKNLTGSSLDWLITGEEQTASSFSVSEKAGSKLASIAHEQARTIFADADIAGPNREARTLELLTEFLIARSLRAFNLIDSEREVMTAADHKRAERFTFVANIPQTLEDRIGEIVERKISGNSVSSVAQEQGIRVMIRELVQEEIERSTKRPFLDIDFGHADESDVPLRKTG